MTAKFVLVIFVAQVAGIGPHVLVPVSQFFSVCVFGNVADFDGHAYASGCGPLLEKNGSLPLSNMP